MKLWNIMAMFLLLAYPGIMQAQQKDVDHLRMYQVEEGPRSIGANVTIVSNFTITCYDHFTVIDLYVQNLTESFRVGEIFYFDCQRDADYIDFRSFPYLNLSSDNTGVVTWYFSYLPESYHGLNLITLSSFGRYMANKSLIVAACETPVTVPTIQQDSEYHITAHGRAYFKDHGNCSCLQKDQVLFHRNGVKASKQAFCAYNAVWSGCENLQCWSAPRYVAALQLNRTVGSPSLFTFTCSFTHGFPTTSSIVYAINNTTIPPDYMLRPSDDGQSLSCEVISQYTLATGEKAKSSFEKIIVYFPPEQATLSNDTVTIDINCSRILHFSFLANPEDENVWLSYDKEYIRSRHGNGSSWADVVSWMENYSQQRLHIYSFEVQVTTMADYGIYNMCASTSKPRGRSCARLTITHPTAAIEGIESNLTVLIGGSVAGAALILTVGVGLYLAFRRRNRKCQATENMNKSEVNCNARYGEYETNICDNRYEEIEPRPNPYENVEQHAAYEETIFPG